MSADDALPVRPAAGPPRGGSGRGQDTEAQLATALLLQARALERSLSEGARSGGGGVLRSRELVALLRRAEQARAEQRHAAARRERRLLGVAGAALVAALLAAGSAAWVAWGPGRPASAGPSGVPVSAADRPSESAAGQAAEADRIAQAVTAALSIALDEQQAVQRETDRLVEAADARAAASQEALAALQGEHRALADALAGRDAVEAALRDELLSTRGERLNQIGENARLVEKVLESDRRIAELQSALAALRDAAATGPPVPDAPRITRGPASGPAGLAALATEALRRSGVPNVRVAEAAGPRNGVLADLLVIVEDERGGQRVVEAATAGLVADGRGMQWLCRATVDAPEPSLVIALPGPDLAAWQALGLTLPEGYLERAAVVAALEVMVGPQGWEVSALDAWDGETLLGLELRQALAGGGERIVRAARGQLSPVGPELVLVDGRIATRGDERPFYGGEYRIALPGADFGGWLAAVGAAGP